MTAQQQSSDQAGQATRATRLVSEASGVRENLTSTIVAEFAVAVAWVMAYVKGGRTWDGLARLAATYHWPQATAFRDLVAPGLTAHATAIAVACPLVLAFLAFSWRGRWPIGGFALFWCGSAYSYLTLGAWLYGILVPLIIVLFCLSERGRVNSYTFMTYFLAGVVTGLVVTGISIWVLPAGILTDGPCHRSVFFLRSPCRSLPLLWTSEVERIYDPLEFRRQRLPGGLQTATAACIRPGHCP